MSPQAPTDRRALIDSIEAQNWDLIIVGGGILGAAVALEAARLEQKVLLLEQRDFAWGTSSRSSKMVHGGLRYLAAGDVALTRDSVRERQHLLTELPGLVEPLKYLFSHRKGKFPGPLVFGILIRIYDFFAKSANRRLLKGEALARHAPYWNQSGLLAATQYGDAVTDDARLVLRVLDEAKSLGAVCVNYARVEELIYQQDKVAGVEISLQGPGETQTLSLNSRVVVSATGPWADQLRQRQGQAAKIRPLRGSHIVLPYWRLPVSQSITFMHPDDKRPVFIYPWEGNTIVGTTDIDHKQDLNEEAAMSRGEFDYLLKGLRLEFPQQDLQANDAVASWSGVRGVVSSGKGLSPSKESREHVVWDDNGLVTVTGGKLTTFRLIALDVLEHSKKYIPGLTLQKPEQIFDPGLSASEQKKVFSQARSLLGFDGAKRIIGRYGYQRAQQLSAESHDDLSLIPNTQTYWFELSWAASEQVLKLEDLLLRRTRLGLQLREGGAEHFERIQALALPKLNWSLSRWQQEVSDYQALWQRCYHPQGNADV